METETAIICWEEGSALISSGIQKLISKVEGDLNDPFSFEMQMHIYDTICTMYNQYPPHDYKQQLYDLYRKSFEDYISSTVLPALAKLHDEFMLRELQKRLENYKLVVPIMLHMFSYLDRYFLRPNIIPIREVAFMCFRECLWNNIRIDVKNAIFELIDREREGEQIDRALLKRSVDIYIDMQDDFEKPMLENTGTYYARKAALWISKHSCPEYMLKAEECLRNEEHRVVRYLHSSSSVQKLMEKVQNEVLSRYETQLLEKQDSGLDGLLSDDRKNDVCRMYRLFCRIPNGLEPVVHIFAEHVTRQGLALVQWADKGRDVLGKQEQEHEYVQKVIEMYDKYMYYVKHAFQENRFICKAMRQAFIIICNKGVGGSTSAEMLAAFCDDVVKKGNIGKRKNDHIDSMLERVVKLVEYINDKDLLIEFCKKNLGRRLLSDKGVHIDREQKLVSMLKEKCGSQLTLKMQGMVDDLAVSKEIQARFNHSNNNLKLTLAVNVTVLNNASWPTYQSCQLNLPSEMARCLEVFKDFYSTTYKHRKLTCIYSLGNCEIISRFDTKTIQMTLTTYQAVLLSFFNDCEKLSYEEIKSKLNLEDEDVTRLLHSVACGKYNILLKHPITATISTSDNFEFNPSFTHKLKKIKIPLTEVDEKKKAIKIVDDGRPYAIDGAIVRIMKAIKVLPQKQLLIDCAEQLQSMFKPDFKAIEERINSLILKEFLERDKENLNLLRYLP